jgi:hypothetical protein
MKIVLDLVCETEEERQEARAYAAALERHAERRQYQGLPGLLLEWADSSIWVRGAELWEG